MSSKMCKICGESKSIEDNFYVYPSGVVNSYCRPCSKEYDKNRTRTYSTVNLSEEQRLAKLEKKAFNAKKHRYGLTQDEFIAKWEEQDRKCAVCGIEVVLRKDYGGEVACIDHDHITGKVRGILCGHCNRAAGFLKDDPDLMRKLAEYIEEFKCLP